MELYLVRHPRVVIGPGVCYGHSDVALAEDPRAAARRLRPLLPPEYALYASPLTRCRLLAEALGSGELGADSVFDERLKELHFGEWELLSFEAVGRAALDAWAADITGFRPPGGETIVELARRVGAFLDELRERGHDHAVVVSHAGPLRVIAGTLLRLAPEHWTGLDFEFGALTRFGVSAHGARLVWFNR